jgi:hypothetical protein
MLDIDVTSVIYASPLHATPTPTAPLVVPSMMVTNIAININPIGLEQT